MLNTDKSLAQSQSTAVDTKTPTQATGPTSPSFVPPVVTCGAELSTPTSTTTGPLHQPCGAWKSVFAERAGTEP